MNEGTTSWLREHGFNPNDLNEPGRYEDTPLLKAARQGHGAIVDELLQHGVDVNHRNMDGTNALWAAVVADSTAIADRLLDAGVDIDNQNDNGATALMFASSSGRTPWVEYLLERGADTSLVSFDGYTALDLASNVDILRLLRNPREKVR